MQISWNEILTVSFILFAVIDILGCVPIIIELRSKTGNIHSAKTTVVAGFIMFAFLYIGEYILAFIGIELGSFAIAGSFILFVMALEMVLGISIIKHGNSGSTSIVPVAFPMIAGVGTITTLLSLRATYADVNIIASILVNLVIVFVVLYFIPRIAKFFGNGGLEVLRKVFGVILMAISVQMFRTNMGI